MWGQERAKQGDCRCPAASSVAPPAGTRLLPHAFLSVRWCTGCRMPRQAGPALPHPSSKAPSAPACTQCRHSTSGSPCSAAPTEWGRRQGDHCAGLQPPAAQPDMAALQGAIAPGHRLALRIQCVNAASNAASGTQSRRCRPQNCPYHGSVSNDGGGVSVNARSGAGQSLAVRGGGGCSHASWHLLLLPPDRHSPGDGTWCLGPCNKPQGGAGESSQT